MTADNPTVDDLRLVARNLEAEGHTSRALILNNAADKLERLEAALKPFADAYKEQGDSHMSPYVCNQNMSALVVYGEWKEAAAALESK